MNQELQTIGTERLYILGKYKNLKFIDTIAGLSKEIILDVTLQNQLRNLQLLRMDRYCIEYKERLKHLNTLTTEEAFELLEELEIETVTNITELMSPNLIDNTTQKE